MAAAYSICRVAEMGTKPPLSRAMPPFGNLCGMEGYVSESLTLDNEIAFKGSHTEMIRSTSHHWWSRR